MGGGEEKPGNSEGAVVAGGGCAAEAVLGKPKVVGVIEESDKEEGLEPLCFFKRSPPRLPSMLPLLLLPKP